jgi:hypothetical protein
VLTFQVARTKAVAYTRADLMSLNHKERIAASCNRKRKFDHEDPSAAEPQPKSKQIFHHEGREEHEGRKLK